MVSLRLDLPTWGAYPNRGSIRDDARASESSDRSEEYAFSVKPWLGSAQCLCRELLLPARSCCPQECPRLGIGNVLDHLFLSFAYLIYRFPARRMPHLRRPANPSARGGKINLAAYRVCATQFAALKIRSSTKPQLRSEASGWRTSLLPKLCRFSLDSEFVVCSQCDLRNRSR